MAQIALVYSTVTGVLLRTVIPNIPSEEASIIRGDQPTIKAGESIARIDNSTLPKNNLGQPIHIFDYLIPAAFAQKGVVIVPPTRIAVFMAVSAITKAARVFSDAFMGDLGLYKPMGRVVLIHPIASVGWTFNQLNSTLQAPIQQGQTILPDPVAVPPAAIWIAPNAI